MRKITRASLIENYLFFLKGIDDDNIDTATILSNISHNFYDSESNSNVVTFLYLDKDDLVGYCKENIDLYIGNIILNDDNMYMYDKLSKESYDITMYRYFALFLEHIKTKIDNGDSISALFNSSIKSTFNVDSESKFLLDNSDLEKDSIISKIEINDIYFDNTKYAVAFEYRVS